MLDGDQIKHLAYLTVWDEYYNEQSYYSVSTYGNLAFSKRLYYVNNNKMNFG